MLEPNLHALPQELLEYLFKFLNDSRAIINFAKVCKQFNELFNEAIAQKRLTSKQCEVLLVKLRIEPLVAKMMNYDNDITSLGEFSLHRTAALFQNRLDKQRFFKKRVERRTKQLNNSGRSYLSYAVLVILILALLFAPILESVTLPQRVVLFVVILAASLANKLRDDWIPLLIENVRSLTYRSEDRKIARLGKLHSELHAKFYLENQNKAISVPSFSANADHFFKTLGEPVWIDPLVGGAEVYLKKFKCSIQ